MCMKVSDLIAKGLAGREQVFDSRPGARSFDQPHERAAFERLQLILVHCVNQIRIAAGQYVGKGSRDYCVMVSRSTAPAKILGRHFERELACRARESETGRLW